MRATGRGLTGGGAAPATWPVSSGGPGAAARHGAAVQALRPIWYGAAGFAFGLVVLHPIAMIIFCWFDPRTAAELRPSVAVLFTTLLHSFTPEMAPMGFVFATAVLEADGCCVTAAADGEEALGLVRRDPPDLVTLDIQMPRKTGVLFYRQMRSEAPLRAIPVVVITGLRQRNAYAAPFVDAFFEFNEPGVSKPDAILDKPVNKDELVSVVRGKLAASRPTAQP